MSGTTAGEEIAILDGNTNRAGVERPCGQPASIMRSLSDSLLAGVAHITNAFRERLNPQWFSRKRFLRCSREA